MDPKQAKFHRAKNRILREVLIKLHAKRLNSKRLFQFPGKIQYIDRPSDANASARALLRDLKADDRDFPPVSIDFEGSGAVLQIYTVLNNVTHAYIFQVNKILKDGKLPEDVYEFLERKEVAYVGKDVEIELPEFLRKFGFPEKRFDDLHIIDVLTLVQSCS